MKNHTVGQIIRTYREREGLTQEELAEIIRVSKGKLSHWESDETIPRPAMVARLIGTLKITDDEATLLWNAVDAANALREQDQAAAQKAIDAQITEEERLMHKSKALKLLLMGTAGFSVGCLLAFLAGSYKDNPWYFVPVIGLLVAGVPFGWSILSDRTKDQYKEIYYNPNTWLFDLILKLLFFILKFFVAYLIGITTFPIILLYHAYKAGPKGSLYKKVMCLILIVAVLLIGLISIFIASATLSGK